ncbi:hypothetical protein FA13DRAFT_1740492 [Coprinellus micaceus]|uniref:UDENN domain-containing protein n=1 Tax=Coprinellus micaceus TaxID=71717 RepID=A0A4Y7SMK9_COPMI|nr:hypothetical protein FA13DRAFT_1740492 [Coprinellus micaceus]
MSVISDHDPRQSFASRSSGSYSYSQRDSVVDAPGGLYARTENVSQGSGSVYSDEKDGLDASIPLPTYPPPPRQDDTASIASTSSRKARPESLLMSLPDGQLVLGVALVDFNHVVGPRIEYFHGAIFEDESITNDLPFLALPDGAHMSAEDYSYFHLVKPGPNPTTIFGISCNQQIAAADLLVKGDDVTRSTVQKAVVVLASKPVFGPIREKLRVVTTALFAQRDFSDYSILEAFGSTLELSLRGQLTESGMYMGTSLRELVHSFRQRTLVLLKALILQKRIMFYGYPVERLCTFQYSLVSLLPGLLHSLDDCGSPPLATRAPTLSKASSLKTSDHKSMLAFMGLPLDVFGKDAFFQPYLPLQQLDMLKGTKSWMCGCTNSIITTQKEVDLLVNTDTGVFEFRDPKLERSAGLTAADRKWMDDIIQDVNEGWGEDDPSNPRGMKMHAGADSSAVEDFNPLWISEFKKTNAYEVWDRITDPLIFDIIEPRHPCNEKPSVCSTNFFKAVEGVRGRWAQRQANGSSPPSNEPGARSLGLEAEKSSRASTPPVEVSKSDIEGQEEPKTATQASFPETIFAFDRPPANGGALSGWGANLGSYFSKTSFGRSQTAPQEPTASAPSSTTTSPTQPSHPKHSSSESTSTWSSISALVSPPPMQRFGGLGAGGAGAGGIGLGAALAAKAASMNGSGSSGSLSGSNGGSASSSKAASVRSSIASGKSIVPGVIVPGEGSDGLGQAK